MSNPSRWSILFAAGLLALGAACTSSTPKAKPSPTPTSTAPVAELTAKQIMERALEAARTRGSFRIVSTLKFQGKTATFVNDVAAKRGKQDITIGVQHAEIRILKSVAYLRANRAALLNFLGFPASIADKMTDRWVRFEATDTGYADIAESVTLDSALNDIALSAPLAKTAARTVAGRRAIGITGKAIDDGSGTLYVALSADHLPIQETNKSKDGTGVITFSFWGETVSVSAPPKPIAFSSIAGSSGGTPA